MIDWNMPETKVEKVTIGQAELYLGDCLELAEQMLSNLLGASEVVFN